MLLLALKVRVPADRPALLPHRSIETDAAAVLAALVVWTVKLDNPLSKLDDRHPLADALLSRRATLRAALRARRSIFAGRARARRGIFAAGAVRSGRRRWQLRQCGRGVAAHCARQLARAAHIATATLVTHGWRRRVAPRCP